MAAINSKFWWALASAFLLVVTATVPVQAQSDDDPVLEETDPADGPDIEQTEPDPADGPDVEEADPADGPDVEQAGTGVTKLNLDESTTDGDEIPISIDQWPTDTSDRLDPDSPTDGPADADRIEDLDELDPLQTRGLWAGPWTGFVSVTGGGVEGEFSFDADLYGGMQLTVDDDDNVDGTFEINGPYIVQGRSADGEILAEMTLSGSGTVTGTGLLPKITAPTTTSGVFTMSAQGQQLTLPVPPDAGNFFDYTVQVDSMVCNEAAGSFSAPLGVDIADLGWNPTAVGTFVALQDTAVIREGIEEYVAQFRGPKVGADTTIETPDYVPRILREYGALIQRFNAWADDTKRGIQGDPSVLIDMMHDWEILNAALRNLSGCTAQILGADLVERFESIMLQAITSLVRRTAKSPDLTGSQLAQLTYASLNVGAIGAGSARSATALETEAILVDANQRIWDRNVDPADGKILINAETRTTIALAAQMGWQVFAEGRFWSGVDVARQLAQADAAAIAAANGGN